MNLRRCAVPRWTGDGILRSIPILLVLGACSEVPPSEPEDPEDPAEPGRHWLVGYVHEITNRDVVGHVDAEEVDGGGVSIVHELGRMSTPPAPHSMAIADIFTDASGHTFWVGAEAPTLNGPDPDATIGAIAGLFQVWRFRKTAPNAVLRFVVSRTALEILDDNSQPIDTAPVCPWGWDLDDGTMRDVCRDAQSASSVDASYNAAVVDTVEADGTRRLTPFFVRSSKGSIVGFSDDSRPRVTVGQSLANGQPLFNADLSDFEIERTGLVDNHLTVRLKSPIVLDVPIETLAPGTEFEVFIHSEARVWTRRHGEVYVSAFFRDPANTGGLSLEYDGLALLEPPADPLKRISSVPAAPACAGEPGGTIQFETIDYYNPEWPGQS